MPAKLQNDLLLFDERENQSSNLEYYHRPINEINIAEAATLDMNKLPIPSLNSSPKGFIKACRQASALSSSITSLETLISAFPKL